MTKIAAQVMANAPLGQAVAIQNSPTVAIVTNARSASVTGGSQSGTTAQNVPEETALDLRPVRIASPPREPETPISVSSVPSATIRDDSDVKLSPTKARTPLTRADCRRSYSEIQRAGSSS